MRISKKISKFVLYSFCLHTVITLFMDIAVAITEDDSTISLRDANSSKDRPKIDAFDLDEDTLA